MYHFKEESFNNLPLLARLILLTKGTENKMRRFVPVGRFNAWIIFNDMKLNDKGIN